jgi:ankyrin repeat protein
MFAVDRQKQQAVAELLARGANPNLKADDGTSAVFLAVENYRDAPDIMFAVIKGGGDPNTRRPDDDPVIMRFLNDRNCEFIRHMKALGADLDITTRAGDPLITDASTARDWDVVWCMIELGAKYDYEKNSRSPLSRSLAAKFPSPDSPIFPYKKKVWQFFKDHGIAVRPLSE